jgi:hypothetical protein
MRIVLMLAFVGCAAPVQLQVTRTNGYLPNALPEAFGTCPATITVRVLDAKREPVAGAAVTTHQRESMNMPSMVPTYELYATTPVLTDSSGEATVCRPDRVAPKTGDWFTNHDGGHVEAKLGERVGQLAPPFHDAIILRMP